MLVPELWLQQPEEEKMPYSTEVAAIRLPLAAAETEARCLEVAEGLPGCWPHEERAA